MAQPSVLGQEPEARMVLRIVLHPLQRLAPRPEWVKVQRDEGVPVEKNLYRFILKHSLKQQITITLLSLASFIPYYYYLSMPKAIVNQGIQGKDIQFPVDLLGLGQIGRAS